MNFRLRRLRLRRRSDSRIFLDRWGPDHPRIGGVFLHHFTSTDPGIDLHDHPWWFCSFVLAGGYVEQRCAVYNAVSAAKMFGTDWEGRGVKSVRRRWSVKSLGLNECHRIVDLLTPTCWTLVIHGPVRNKPWAFYTPAGRIAENVYDDLVDRDLIHEIDR